MSRPTSLLLQKKNGMLAVNIESPSFIKRVRELLQSENLIEELDTLDRLYGYQGNEFFCETLQSKIVVPCSLVSCKYHISHQDTSAKKGHGHCQCLLKHKFDNNLQTITPDELSVLTDIPALEIKKSIDQIFTRLRSYMLKVEIDTGRYNRFDYLDNSVPVCVVCGALVSKKSFVHETDHGELLYCSRPCYKKKPPTLLKLEVQYRTDIRVILATSKKIFKRLPIISSVLDVKRRTLLKWYEEFLGIHANVFGIDACDYVDVMRRPTPTISWTLDFLSNSSVQVPQKLMDLEQATKKLVKSL